MHLSVYNYSSDLYTKACFCSIFAASLAAYVKDDLSTLLFRYIGMSLFIMSTILCLASSICIFYTLKLDCDSQAPINAKWMTLYFVKAFAFLFILITHLITAIYFANGDYVIFDPKHVIGKNLFILKFMLMSAIISLGMSSLINAIHQCFFPQNINPIVPRGTTYYWLLDMLSWFTIGLGFFVVYNFLQPRIEINFLPVIFLLSAAVAVPFFTITIKKIIYPEVRNLEVRNLFYPLC